MQKNKKLITTTFNIFSVFSIIIVLAYIGIYRFKNNIYLLGDAGQYFDTTQQIFIAAKESIFKFFQELYFNRAKPTFFPVTGVPFLLVMNGNVKNAVTFHAVFFGLFLATYLFLLLRTRLSILGAGLATAFIMSMPILICQYLSYFSEIVFIPLAIASFFHLLKTKNFSIKKHSYACAIFTALAFCVRPGISIFTLILPYIIEVLYSIKNKSVSIGAAIKSLWGSTILIYLLFAVRYLGEEHHSHYGAVALLAFTLTLIIINISKYRTDKKSRTFLSSTFIMYFLIFAWFCCFPTRLIDFSLSASVGTLSLQGPRFDVSYIQFVYDTFFRLISPIGLIFIIPFLIHLYFDYTKKQFYKGKESLQLFSLIIIPVLAGAATNAGDIRYYILSGLFAYIVILQRILRKDLHIHLALLITGTIIQLIAISAKQSPATPHFMVEKFKYKEPDVPAPYYEKVSPAEMFVSQLIPILPRLNHPYKINLITLTNQTDLEYYHEVWIINILIREKENPVPYIVDNPSFEYKGTYEYLNILKKSAPFFIAPIITMSDEMEETDDYIHYNNFLRKIKNAYYQNKLHVMGLKLIHVLPQINVISRPRTCLLLGFE